MSLRSLSIALVLVAPQVAAAVREPVTVHVFHDVPIQFAPEDSRGSEPGLARASDRGRVISRTVALPRLAGPHRVTARVRTRPMPKDATSMHDGWDRAASVRLRLPDAPAVEIIKFVTAYGGPSDHEVDVTELAPLLRGACTFEGFVDTWSSPGWRMDFLLTFSPVAEDVAPSWVASVLHDQAVTAASQLEAPLRAEVEVPSGLERLALRVLVSGHCTDGRGADEFESKDNVVLVEGREVLRFRPWRDDCRRFRERNPYCRRWADGSWSSDYSRSGWCPGNWVRPRQVALTEALGPGRHVVEYAVEGVRLRDEAGQEGYWRVSCALLGWRAADVGGE